MTDHVTDLQVSPAESAAGKTSGPTETSATDEQLVRRAQSGDRQALGDLYDRHHERIFRFILLRSGEQALAEDLTGEVFIRMLDGLPRYRLTGIPFTAWLYRIARNLLTDHYRKEGSYIMSSLDESHAQNQQEPGPAAAVERNLTLQRVHRSLAQLDPAEADVIMLRFLSGLSLKEVAQALEKSVAAIKALQHRGLVSLRAAQSRRAAPRLPRPLQHRGLVSLRAALSEEQR